MEVKNYEHERFGAWLLCIGVVLQELAVVNRSGGIRLRGGCREKYEEICANEEKAVTLRSVWQSAAK